MTNNYTFSYIITYRHNPERIINLKKVINWVMTFTKVELIVVEQDKEKHLDGLYIPGQYIFEKSTLPFNKSNAFNVGLSYVTTPIVVFGDCDVIMNQEDFIKALNDINEYDVVNPYNNVIDLTERESMLNYTDIFNIKREGRGKNDNQKVPMCGGITVFRTNAAKYLGGWNEDFFGWGCEDDFESLLVKKFLKYKENDSDAYHYYHTRPAPDMNFYKRNLDLLNKLSQLDDDKLKNIIMTQQRINGSKIRFETY